MKKFIHTAKSNLLFASLLGISSFVSAQESAKTQSGGGGGFTIGYGFMDVSKLHDFVPAGIGSFGSQHLLLGGTGHAVFGDFVIGGTGVGIVTNEIKTDSFNYRPGGGYGTFDFGYMVLNKEKIKIFPMLGIGGGGYGIQIVRNKTLALKDVVNAPANEINMDNGGFVFDLSVNIHWIPVMKYDEKEKSHGGFMAGLQVGYVYSLPSSNWTYSGGDIIGGPEFGLNMAYFKLIIGGFGYDDSE